MVIMKRFVVLLVLLLAVSSHAVETGVFRRTLASDANFEYWYNVPKNYDPVRKYPLIFTLHGMGNSGHQFVQIWNPDGVTLEGGRQLKSSDIIVVGPTFTGDGWPGAESSAKKIGEIFEITFKDFNIDRENVFFHGFSGGGACAWSYLWKHKNGKDNVITGGVFLTGANCWRRLKPDTRYPLDLPWFIEVGDGEWNLADLGPDGLAAEENLKKAGYKSVVFHKIENQGHGIGPTSLKLIFEWMYDQMNRKDLGRVKAFEPKLAAAQAASDAGRCGEAAALLEDAAALSPKHPSVQAALELRKKIEAGAATEFAAAQKLIDAKNYAGGIAALQGVSTKFKGLPAAKQADEKLSGLAVDSTVKVQLAQQKNHAEAQKRLEAAQKLEADKSFALALKGYDETAAQFKDAPAGQAAAAAAQKMRADTALMTRLSNTASKEEAVRKLRSLKNFLKNGNAEKAQELFDELAGKHPGSPELREARELMAAK